MGKTAKRALMLIEQAIKKNCFSGEFIDRKTLYLIYCNPAFLFGADSESAFNSTIFWLKSQFILGNMTSRGFHFDKINFEKAKKIFKISPENG